MKSLSQRPHRRQRHRQKQPSASAVPFCAIHWRDGMSSSNSTRKPPSLPRFLSPLKTRRVRPYNAVEHRKFLRKFRRRYKLALMGLGINGRHPKTAQGTKNIPETSFSSTGDLFEPNANAAANELRQTLCCQGSGDPENTNDVVQTSKVLDINSKDSTSATLACQGEITRAEDGCGESDDDSCLDLPPETPPLAVVDLLEQETTLCDSPKQRGVVDDAVGHTERLPFGYFQCGHQLYRNKLNDQELLEEGFVALHQLVLPYARSALLTTFDSGATMKASIHLASVICPEIPKVLLVGHSDYLGSPYVGLRLSLAPQKVVLKEPREWYWIACRPFGRSEHLMHAKILLFRSDDGLRIVISGNNLTEKQWTEDRDCIWIQDVPVAAAASREHDTKQGLDEPPMTRLRCFLVDLLKSSVAFHDVSNRTDQELLNFVHSRIGQLMDSLDDNAVNSHNVRFVYSFPRMTNRGGWQQLRQAVKELRQRERIRNESERSHLHDQDDLWYDTDEGDGAEDDFDAFASMRVNLFAMSGSFGDLNPDFLLQMSMAMSGATKNGCCKMDDKSIKCSLVSLQKSLPWSSVRNTFCLWPSSETVRTMNPIAVLGRCRPMSLKHWESIPVEARKRLFFDAIPNPGGPSLASSTESQAEVGYGRNLAPTFLGFRLRNGPLSCYHSFAHGKAIFATTMNQTVKSEIRPHSVDQRSNEQGYSAVYIGSHNFSKNAWGIRESRPRNVEFGVLLLTTDQNVATKWRTRLPYKLPDTNRTSPAHYRPGRHSDIFQRIADNYFSFPRGDGSQSSVETI